MHESKLSPSGAREEEWKNGGGGGAGGAGFWGKCGGTGREEVSRENTPKAKMGGGGIAPNPYLSASPEVLPIISSVALLLSCWRLEATRPLNFVQVTFVAPY